jgi:16S rRNA (adenine1518-N6/adenine1519-N6)-dimethyltransferase
VPADFHNPAATMARNRLTTKKSLGQNFLVDSVMAQAILDALPPKPGAVVEIGAGPGTMTRALAQTRDRVAAVELDPRLVPVLSAELAPFDGAVVVEGDVLELPLADLLPGPYGVFGNIPYHITGLLIPHLLELQPPPEWVAVLVQLEVAERLCAEPGGWSLATLAVRSMATAELLLRVPAQAFDPAPKVDSALVLLRPHTRAAFADKEFFDFARAVFQERRKKLPNAVANAFGHDVARGRAVVADSGLDQMRRPQTLNLDEWGVLYNAYRKAG